MKMQFNLVIKGNDSLEQKFKEALEQNPTLHLDLIRSFGQAIILGLRLKDDDGILIESFRASKIEEPQEPVVNVEMENKVDN